MTATPSVSKTTVSGRCLATPSVHLYRFLPSGSVFVPAFGGHCFGVLLTAHSVLTWKKTAHAERRRDD
jgi:hypothetical protein